MPPKKRGRPAKKQAQPAVCRALNTPTTTPGPATFSEPAETPSIGKKRGRPKKSTTASVEPARKRGRPRKQSSATPSPAGRSASRARSFSTAKSDTPEKSGPTLRPKATTVGDSQEDSDGSQSITNFNQQLKDAMKEVFIDDALNQKGGIWIPWEAAVQMQQAFAPTLPVPEEEVFVRADLVEIIRENLC